MSGFTSAGGWGSYAQKIENGKLTAEISVHWNGLNLKTIALECGPAKSVGVTVGERTIPASISVEGKKAAIKFERSVAIKASEKMEINLIAKS